MLIKTFQPIDAALVMIMKRRAKKGAIDVSTNYSTDPYFISCGHVCDKTGSKLRFTRDEGYHTCGWWKNPDYERCYHLSLSFSDPESGMNRKQDKKLAEQWIKALYGAYIKWVWCEPPFSSIGRLYDVWHYRLFCDAGWQPLKPRGEVYSKELTEAGWQSWSEVKAAKEPRRVIIP